VWIPCIKEMPRMMMMMMMIIIIIITIMPLLLYILSKLLTTFIQKKKKYPKDTCPLECAFHPKINSSRMTTVTTIFSYEIKQISQSDTCHVFYGRTVINPLALEQDI
jgi:hypothetical protein